jgi:hypothetical protein
MTYRYGRTSRGRYAATLAGVPTYTPVSLKATNHLTAPAPVAPAAPDTSWVIPCGEDDARKYGQVPKRRRKRRRGRRRRGAKKARGTCPTGMHWVDKPWPHCELDTPKFR